MRLWMARPTAAWHDALPTGQFPPAPPHSRLCPPALVAARPAGGLPGWTLHAVDNLDGTIANEEVAETYLIGSTPVGTTLSDKAGNQGTCSFRVRVEDVEPPVVTCPKTAVFLAGDPDPTHARVSCELTVQGKVSGNATDRDGFCFVQVRWAAWPTDAGRRQAPPPWLPAP